MRNNQDKVLVLPGGDGIASYLMNSIETPIPKKTICTFLKKTLLINGRDKKLLDEISNSKQDSYSVWGYSKDNSTLKSELPKEGMPIFITYKNAAIYKAVIYKILEDPDNLLDLWAGRSWEYKILLNNVIKIFIPDPNNTYESKKTLKGLIENNEFGKMLEHTRCIEDLYEGTKKIGTYEKYGFSQIIGRTTKGNIQGALFSEFTRNKVEEEFEKYVINCHGECIVEVFDGIGSDD